MLVDNTCEERVLANLPPNETEMEPMPQEMGHGVYDNYLLGEMLASQFEHTLRAKAEGKVLTPEGGRWFVDNVFTPGAKYSWNTMIEHATGEKLNPAYLVQQFNY